MDMFELIGELNDAPVDFKKVIQVIDTEFDFYPTTFKNGEIINQQDTNNGSCKIFAFAQFNGLSQQATLNAFGDYYTKDVLENPDATNHQNIRNFMKYGWEGIKFEGQALRRRKKIETRGF